MDLKNALNWRYAVKKFLPDKLVPQEKIDLILDAARKAPSSKNFQPWKFVVISDKPFQQRLQAISMNQEKIGTASHVVVLAALKRFPNDYADRLAHKTVTERQQTPEEEAALLENLKRSIAKKDPETIFQWASKMLFAALGFLVLAAALEDVDAGPMDGFNHAQVDELLGLTNSDYGSVVMVALGYRDPTDKYAHVAKVRFEPKDVIERRP